MSVQGVLWVAFCVIILGVLAAGAALLHAFSWVPYAFGGEVPIGASLGVIVGILVAAIGASLVSRRSRLRLLKWHKDIRRAGVE